jgi:hypothetical protein
VYDLAGSRVWHETRAFAAGEYALSYGGLPAGAYMLRISGPGLELRRALPLR